MMKLREVLLPFGKKIKQTQQGQGISSDTEFLVQTVLDNEKQEMLRILELGSGNGIISIMLKAYRLDWEITGYEIQSHLVDLAKENSSNVGFAITFLKKDIAFLDKPSYQYDVIVTNPPYIKVNAGKVSPSKERAIARQEISCTMETVLNRIKMDLTKSGRAYIMYPTVRWEEFVEETKKVDLKVLSRFISKKGKNKVFIAKISREM